jgi:hypothetical protein
MFKEGIVKDPEDIYSVSVYALLSKSRVTLDTAAPILPAGSGKVVPNGGKYTRSMMYSQKEIYGCQKSKSESKSRYDRRSVTY